MARQPVDAARLQIVRLALGFNALAVLLWAIEAGLVYGTFALVLGALPVPVLLLHRHPLAFRVGATAVAAIYLALFSVLLFYITLYFPAAVLLLAAGALPGRGRIVAGVAIFTTLVLIALAL